MLTCMWGQVVCDFCAEHLEANKAAFADPRLELIYDDARAQLEASEGQPRASLLHGTAHT